MDILNKHLPYCRARFVFRRPLLSSVSNIFILPFQPNVWIAIAVLLIVVLCLLYLSIKLEYQQNTNTKSADYWKQLNPSEQTVSDNLLIILGAFAQQGRTLIIDNIIIDFDLRTLFENNKKLLR